MRDEQVLEGLDLLLRRGVQGEAEEDDAGVGEALAEDEFTEVLMGGKGIACCLSWAGRA